MIDILKPQRFYQIEYTIPDSCVITTIIDLKTVTEISLKESRDIKEISFHREHPPMISNILINHDKNATEEYLKIVTAWTTYKMATER